jgi:2'-5' RNA ligase
VAVEVPEHLAHVLAQARRESGDPVADEMAPHITLVPPVHVPEHNVPEVHELLSAAARAMDPFEVHLRGTGSFRPVSDVVFVAVASGIGALEKLAAALRVRPLDPPLHFPYHPHVTLAQDVEHETLDRLYHEHAGFEARFEVASFRLYEHAAGCTASPPAGGRRWHAIADVPLG